MKFILPLLLVACAPSPSSHKNSWTQIDAPPGAPYGTKCYVWAQLNQFNADSAYGGPACFVPEKK